MNGTAIPDGRVSLGGRWKSVSSRPSAFELLEGIERCQSISAAARAIGMSYRHAWLLVQAVNEAAGVPLVIAVTGGSGGGGARLTPEGCEAIAVFRELQGQLRLAAEGLMPQLPSLAFRFSCGIPFSFAGSLILADTDASGAFASNASCASDRHRPSLMTVYTLVSCSAH